MAEFDAALAAYPTETLAIERVVDVLSITHAPHCVASYRDAMVRGHRFPPISVLRVGRHRIVVDGHKRLSAYRMLGRSEILVEVWPLRRCLRDQWSQIVAGLEKNRRIVYFALVDPAEAARLLRSSALHWKRVALCLLFFSRGAKPARRNRV